MRFCIYFSGRDSTMVCQFSFKWQPSDEIYHDMTPPLVLFLSAALFSSSGGCGGVQL